MPYPKIPKLHISLRQRAQYAMQSLAPPCSPLFLQSGRRRIVAEETNVGWRSSSGVMDGDDGSSRRSMRRGSSVALPPPSTPPPDSAFPESAAGGALATPTHKLGKLPSVTPLTPLTPVAAVTSTGRLLNERAVLGKAPASSTPGAPSNLNAAFGGAADALDRASGGEPDGGAADPDDDSASSI
jgi:hypothetical protein